MGKHRIDDGRQCNSCDEKEGGRTRRMVEGATATGRGWGWGWGYVGATGERAQSDDGPGPVAQSLLPRAAQIRRHSGAALEGGFACPKCAVRDRASRL
jgi:hypothetical protein